MKALPDSLTKREYLASAAMTGLLAQPETRTNEDGVPMTDANYDFFLAYQRGEDSAKLLADRLAMHAVLIADALVYRLEKS